MLLAREARPGRMGDVMTVIAVPALLGPILGPVLGGVIIDGLSWRFIFLHAAALGDPPGLERRDILQRLGGAIGTAVFAVVLQHGLDTGQGASAYGAAFWCALALTVPAAVLLPDTPPAAGPD